MTNLDQIMSMLQGMETKINKIALDVQANQKILTSLTTSTIKKSQSPPSTTKETKSTTEPRLENDYDTLIGQEIPSYQAYTEKGQEWKTTNYTTFVREGSVTFTPDNSEERQKQIAGWEKYLDFQWISGTHFKVRKKGKFIPYNASNDCISRRAIYTKELIPEHEYTYEELCLAVRHYPSTSAQYIALDISRIQQYVKLEELPNGNFIIHGDANPIETPEESKEWEYQNKYGFDF